MYISVGSFYKKSIKEITAGKPFNKLTSSTSAPRNKWKEEVCACISAWSIQIVGSSQQVLGPPWGNHQSHCLYIWKVWVFVPRILSARRVFPMKDEVGRSLRIAFFRAWQGWMQPFPVSRTPLNDPQRWRWKTRSPGELEGKIEDLWTLL